MNKYRNIIELTQSIAKRSICTVKVGSVVYDSYGIFAWGWNHVGKGFGECAERYAVRRANKRRLKGASICIISYRRGKMICSFPCPKCFAVLKACGIKYIECNDTNRKWGRYAI